MSSYILPIVGDEQRIERLSQEIVSSQFAATERHLEDRHTANHTFQIRKRMEHDIETSTQDF